MRRIKFPARGADGTFDVLIRLEGLRDPEPSLRAWLGVWAAQNATWSRTWTSAGNSTTDTLRLLEEFFAAPELENLTGDRGVLRLRVRAESKWWKDWMAKLTDDFMRAHPGSSLSGFESA